MRRCDLEPIRATHFRRFRNSAKQGQVQRSAREREDIPVWVLEPGTRVLTKPGDALASVLIGSRTASKLTPLAVSSSTIASTSATDQPACGTGTAGIPGDGYT